MYSRSITTKYRTAFVIAIDLSGSMEEEITFRRQRMTKAQAVADVVNMILGELIERARREDGLHDYYDIAVIGYSARDAHSLLKGDGESPFVSVCDLEQMGRVVEQTINRETLTSQQPMLHTLQRRIWVEPMASGQTPMYEALYMVKLMIQRWCKDPKNINHCAPFIVNITDGNATDCEWTELVRISNEIKSISTNMGNSLLVNVHLSAEQELPSLIFPTEQEIHQSENDYVRALALAASDMPACFDEAICSMRGLSEPRQFKSMSYNASIAELLAILNIGSISVKRG